MRNFLSMSAVRKRLSGSVRGVLVDDDRLAIAQECTTSHDGWARNIDAPNPTLRNSMERIPEISHPDLQRRAIDGNLSGTRQAGQRHSVQLHAAVFPPDAASDLLSPLIWPWPPVFQQWLSSGTR